MRKIFKRVVKTTVAAVLISTLVFNTTALAADSSYVSSPVNAKAVTAKAVKEAEKQAKKQDKEAQKQAKEAQKQAKEAQKQAKEAQKQAKHAQKEAAKQTQDNVFLEVFEQDSWLNAENKTIGFYSESFPNAEAVLWEPGAEYQLPQLRISNNTRTDIEYTVEIAGIRGDAKLNDVIQWYFISGETKSELGDISGVIKAGEVSDPFTISGHMIESASNDYQGLSIKGISINVKPSEYVQTPEEDVIDGPYYTINTDTDLVIDEQGRHIVFNDEEINYLASVDGQKITLSDATYSGKTVALLFGQYRDAAYCNFNNEVNNINVLGLNVCNGIYNGTDKMSIAVYAYGNTVLNNCTMTQTTSTAEGFEVYDFGSVNKSVTQINGGRYGSVYVWSQAHVTINDAEVDKIVSAAITTRNLGMLTIGSGTHVGTIDLTVGGWTQYKPALTIEDGAVVDSIVYNGVSYTQDEWINNNPVQQQ